MFHFLESSDLKNIKCLLVDSGGVLFGGDATGFYPGVLDALNHLKRNGKIIGILANSASLVNRLEAKLNQYGLNKEEHYDFFVTAGQVFRNILCHSESPFDREILGKKYWVLGEIDSKHKASYIDLFKDTVYERVERIQDADFIYVEIPRWHGEDESEVDIFKSWIDPLAPYQLPMVCPNPDRFAQEGNPPRAVVRQGAIAQLYEERGGAVYYFGKPYFPIFGEALKIVVRHYGIIDKNQILMIGDTPETDILGGNQAGLLTALILGTGNVYEAIERQGETRYLSGLRGDEKPIYCVRHFSSLSNMIPL